MSRERITFNGDLLDEVVAVGGTLHVEGLDAHTYMIVWSDGDEYIHLEGNNLRLYDLNCARIPITDGGPLLCCCEAWGRYPAPHMCTEDTGHPGRHRCDCGASKAAS